MNAPSAHRIHVPERRTPRPMPKGRRPLGSRGRRPFQVRRYQYQLFACQKFHASHGEP
jgi:hypothetical protein